MYVQQSSTLGSFGGFQRVFETSPISKLAYLARNTWAENPDSNLEKSNFEPFGQDPQVHLPKNPYINPIELSPQKKTEVCIRPLNSNKPD